MSREELWDQIEFEAPDEPDYMSRWSDEEIKNAVVAAYNKAIKDAIIHFQKNDVNQFNYIFTMLNELKIKNK